MIKEEECTYPDCGCPEARLCMAKNPNQAAIALNRAPSKESSKRIVKERIYLTNKSITKTKEV